MNFEGTKNIILTILVIISVFLTWSIWTYQPKLEKIDPDDYIKIDSEKQDINDIIRPDSVMFHQKGKHYQTNDEKVITDMLKEMTGWSLYDIRDVSASIKNFPEFVHGNGKTEINFSNAIPFGLFHSNWNMDIKTVPSYFIDYIVFENETIRGEDTSMYFVSYDKKKVFEMKVNGASIENFNRSFLQESPEYPEYYPYEANASRTLFFPVEEPIMHRYKFYSEDVDTEKFKDALFNDPNFVKRESVERGAEYTDGKGLLRVYNDTSMISYVNPGKKSDMGADSEELLKKSIGFINDHAGWENNYRFGGVSEAEQEIIFRLYIDGYPVFNDLGMSEMELIWGKDDIYRYERPFFSLDFAFPEESVMSLPSAGSVMEALKKVRNFDLNELDDMRVGYKLIKSSPDTQIIVLEPAWYYRYSGTWGLVPVEKTGGEDSGLE